MNYFFRFLFGVVCLTTSIMAANKPFLFFDGHNLSVHQNKQLITQFPSNSGRPFFNTSKNQFLKNKGPLPEGAYTVRLDKIVHFNQPDFFTKIKWMTKYLAWGNLAMPLEPNSKNIMKGRHSFMIHGGGWFVGSKGCVVVYGRDMELEKLLKNSENLELVVKY